MINIRDHVKQEMEKMTAFVCPQELPCLNSFW